MDPARATPRVDADAHSRASLFYATDRLVAFVHRIAGSRSISTLLQLCPRLPHASALQRVVEQQHSAERLSLLNVIGHALVGVVGVNEAYVDHAL